MKKIIVSILMMCLQALIIAQNPGEIKGKVVDAKTKGALVGATVSVDVMGNPVATIVDKSGYFTLKPLDPGTYNLKITFMGYDTIKYLGIIVSSDKITFLDDTYASEGTKTLPPFEVKRKLIDRDIHGDPLTPIVFDHMPDKKKINTIIQTTYSDVYVSDNGEEIYFRGSRDGDAVYIVDGIKLRDNQLHIPGLAIGSVAVYTGGVPAKYGDFTGGVVVVETQSYFSWLNAKKAVESTKK